MRTCWTLLLSLTLVACSLSCASDLALTGAKVYPSPLDPPIENGSVLIHDGHILALGPSSATKIPHAARVIDCKGLVVTAGFWNSHVHILPPALLHARDSDARSSINSWRYCSTAGASRPCSTSPRCSTIPSRCAAASRLAHYAAHAF